MSNELAELVKQLQTTLSQMEVALGAIADAVVFVDQQRRVQWYNRAFEQLVQLSNALIMGAELSELLPLMQAGQQMNVDADSDIKQIGGQYELVRGDRTLLLDISCNQVSSGDRMTILVIRDITPSPPQTVDSTTAQSALNASKTTLQTIINSAMASIISDKKQAEIALAESEFKFRNIVENAGDVLCIVNLDGVIRYVSPNVVNLLGFTPAEMEGQSFEPFVYPNEVPKFRDAFHQLATLGERISGLEYRAKHKEGYGIWQLSNLSSFRDAKGEWLIIGVIRDITERKQAEAALEHRVEVERLLSSIARHFIDQEVDTAINFTLEAIAKFIGVERTTIFEYSQDQTEYTLIHEWNIPGLEPMVSKASSAKQGLTTRFSWFNRCILKGQALQVSDTAQVPPEAASEREFWRIQSTQSFVAVPTLHCGKVVGCLSAEVIHFSKTWTQDEINLLKLVGELIAMGRARHKAEAALLVAKEAAEAANRAKSTFLANMSHELRTPLNAILGFAQLLERDTTNTPRQRESLAIINRSGEHLLNLINDVLEMSKIEAGRLILNPKPVNLRRLLQTLQEIFQTRTQTKQLFLRFEIAPDLPHYVITDEGKLRQVLMNLLSNAVKFTERGGITLRARTQARNPQESPMYHTLFFEVEDTGKGIAHEEKRHLFQPFVQTTSGIEAREGTGLGLTISRQFVRLMGGDIQLISTLGEGSIFRFNIQVTLTNLSAVAPILTHQRVLKLASNQPKYRILIVDDRSESRDLLTELLDTVGFETRTATNGQEAIQKWQQWHPHLIWMDMRMPVMDGYEATRQIRQQETRGEGEQGDNGDKKDSMNVSPYQPTIIIALTASAFEEQRANILAAGCNDFVGKPFREQIIFDKMAEYLKVTYLYQQDNESPKLQAQTSQGGKILTSDDLATMPTEWVTQLHQAALEVDADRVLQLIEQIPETHQSLAQGLTDWVRHFCFDEILELTDLD